MKIESHKELEQLIKICVKNGVKAIQVDGISIELGDVPVKPKRYSPKPDPATVAISNVDESIQIPRMIDDIEMPDQLTDEQKLFYSSDSVEPVN